MKEFMDIKKSEEGEKHRISEYFLGTRYRERVMEISNKEDSLLHQLKTLVIKEANIDSQTFIKDFCDVLCKKTHYGKMDVIIPPIPESVGSWTTDVAEMIEKQKKTIQQGEEYNIPSFKEYLFSYYEVKEIIEEGDPYEKNKIIKDLPSYGSNTITNFFEKNGMDILKELEDKDLLSFSYDINPHIYLKTNFLMITPEDQNGVSLWGENFINRFKDCVNGGSLPSEEEIKQSGVGQLLYQQGYTFADLVQTEKTIHSDTAPVFVKTSLFLDSLRDELFSIINENENTGGVLTLCGLMSITDFYLTLKNPENKLVFDEKTFLGIHDPQNGEYRHFTLSLEKPAILPVKDCLFMIEEAECTPHSLNTVGSMCQIPWEVWEHEPQIIVPDAALPAVDAEKIAKKQPKMG